jgi:hypothetical protein
LAHINEIRAVPMTAASYKIPARLVPICAIILLALITPCRLGFASGPKPMLQSSPTSNQVSALPSLTLESVRGGTFPLRVQPAQPLLLAFLQTVPDTAPTPSRSQVVFLLSMAHQYGPRGLRVAIVDASTLVPSQTPAPEPTLDAVVNASYDWQLTVPLLFDPDSQLARQLQITQVPTTFLVAADGRILQRWQGLTRPAVLAQGIERILGGPLGQTPPR